jgi:hypothetical protein
MEYTMQCETSTQKVPFTFNVNSPACLITITSNAGHVHEYKLESLKDLYNWLRTTHPNNWVLLGSINEENVPVAGSVEEWSRSLGNPVGGFYGETRTFRGRFASYIPAILEKLGYVELEGLSRNNRVRAR